MCHAEYIMNGPAETQIKGKSPFVFTDAFLKSFPGWKKNGLEKHKQGTTAPRQFATSTLSAGDKTEKVLARYWLNHGFSYVTIVENHACNLEYKVYEPVIDFRERILLEEVHTYLRDVLIYDTVRQKGEITLDYEDVRRSIRHFIPDFSEDRVPVIFYYLSRNLRDYGPVDPLMYDPRIEDISCNGPDTPVFHLPYKVWLDCHIGAVFIRRIEPVYSQTFAEGR